jgi:hypothetical protein
LDGHRDDSGTRTFIGASASYDATGETGAGVLVATAGDARDRRRAVALTPAGRRVTEAATVVAAQITAQTLAPL